MTTYAQLNRKVYGKEGEAALASEDLATRQAWAVMKALSDRKGFDWWFEDLDKAIQNEIFNEMRAQIRAVGLGG